MAYWLLKTEPSTYSFSDLLRDRQTCWDGIENAAALKWLRSAQVGDGAIVYHTGDERAAVGEAEISEAAYPDPQRPQLAVVDLRVKGALAKPVSLATLKADPLFVDSPLVRQGRLSFVPLTAAQWRRIHELAAD